jgi:UDP-glucose 4-epimerase
LRIFNAYGPGQAVPPTHAPVIPQFVRQILGGGSLVIYGEGQQIRDYVYVDDVVRALAAAATAPNVASQIINIGTGVGTSINDLVRAIERVTGRQATTVVNPSVSGGVSSLVADTGRARRLLDYQPRVALAEGLARLIEEEPNLRP